MVRDGGVRASVGRSITHGIVSWGMLACIAAAVLVTRVHSADAARAPLPAMVEGLSHAEYREWKSFPDYHDVVPVFVYHSVGGRANYLDVSRPLFARQMHALKLAGFHPISIQQYANYVRHGPRGLPSRPILFTFDDGRLDAYRAANAILQEYHFQATEVAVPAWVTKYPGFSLSWSELQQMQRSRIWDVQLHFGYGQEDIQINKAGKTGSAFADLSYAPGEDGRPGHLETFAQFKQRVSSNMEWGVRQMQLHIPGYQPLSMAIPESNYGQDGTNDDRIPPFVISWLDRHFPVVFGGDYLDRTLHHRFQMPGRFSRKLSFRMVMGPRENLNALRCRLLDFVHRTPVWKEYSCLAHLLPVTPLFPDTNPLVSARPEPKPADERDDD
jgi:hypothetical protein